LNSCLFHFEKKKNMFSFFVLRKCLKISGKILYLFFYWIYFWKKVKSQKKFEFEKFKYLYFFCILRSLDSISAKRSFSVSFL
jgi:hypothetical protein